MAVKFVLFEKCKNLTRENVKFKHLFGKNNPFGPKAKTIDIGCQINIDSSAKANETENRGSIGQFYRDYAKTTKRSKSPKATIPDSDTSDDLKINRQMSVQEVELTDMDEYTPKLPKAKQVNHKPMS